MAQVIHFVRHGEVHNPEKILYGLQPGWKLSERGNQMAEVIAQWSKDLNLGAIHASPLQRAQETVAPIIKSHNLQLTTDKNLIEASKDLGANEFKTFRKVIFPLSIGGVVSGTIMTLLPAMTAFALPERLGGSKIILIGNIVEDYFIKSGNINAGSLISIILMVVIVVMFIVIVKFDKEGETLI